MKLVKPSFEILEQSGSIFKDIERAARTCYKSEDKITDTSAEMMVKKLIENKHTAMLEHGTVYLQYPVDISEATYLNDRYINNKYSKVVGNGVDGKITFFVTTNYRVLVENNWLEDLQYKVDVPSEFHEKRISVKFVCDRGVSHEFVRHRVFSFAQESTRYCNYSLDKFDNQLTFIIPCFANIHPSEWTAEQVQGTTNLNDDLQAVLWLRQMSLSELVYNELVVEGWKAQEARSILPNSLKTELVMTGTETEWKGFFILRTATAAHPQARELAIPLLDEFKRRSTFKVDEIL